jgi:hypothetical protein
MSGQSCGAAPILCAHLIRKVDEALISLLRSLAPAEWDLQTIVPSWMVRDVAAHLLDTALRKLSAVRDSCFVEAAEIRSPQDVITLVNRLNREGVTVYRRSLHSSQGCSAAHRPPRGARNEKCQPKPISWNLLGINRLEPSSYALA